MVTDVGTGGRFTRSAPTHRASKLVILNAERDEQDVNQTVSSLEMAFDKGEFVSVNSQATSIYKNRTTPHE